MDRNFEAMKAKVDTVLGVSDWLLIEQEHVTKFGEVTFDLEPLHTDPDWCKENSPYGVPIAYGFQTMGLLTKLFNSATNDLFMGSYETPNFPLNYGFDRLRLISPVRVGARIRGVFKLKSVVEKRPGEMLMCVDALVELEGEDRPAVIADWLMMWVSDDGRQAVSRAIGA